MTPGDVAVWTEAIPSQPGAGNGQAS
jgi:hypothetical protein